MQMQKRVVATAAALILLCVGLLVKRHEADTAHAREQSGRVIHAQEVDGHHEVSPTAHLHGRAAHGSGHAGECAFVAIAHAPLVGVTAPTVVARVASQLVIVEVVHAHAGVATYLIAPKTSPPTA